MGTRPQTISINPGKVMQQAKTETATPENKTEPSFGEDVPYTPEQLSAALKTYIDSLGPAKKQNLLIIWTDNKHRIDGHLIRITATNKVQANLLEQEKPDMLDMIRARLKNRQVALEITVELPPEAPVAKILSNNERFDILAGKNPVLADMKQRFDLDTETPH